MREAQGSPSRANRATARGRAERPDTADAAELQLEAQDLNLMQNGKSWDGVWEGDWDQHLHTRQELRRWST